ncbi:bacillithiol system redox-active protein YtxJ [Pseudoneobacillus sp. C159]
MVMKQIHHETQLKEVLNQGGAVFVLKHSTTCPISQAAFGEYEKFSNENAEIKCYYLTVQDARLLSNYIAETYQIQHESPQVFLFKNGEVKWNVSHWKITNSTLTTILKENQ